jgi:predicted TIM-barrel fold metal-dependent hydrolase
MHRRHLLKGCCAALGAGLFTGLVPQPAAAAWLNPCRGALPATLAGHDLVLQALDGLDAGRLVDTHAHLLGTGDGGSGCSVHPAMQQWWRPVEVLRRRVILNAACVPADAPSVDRAYLDNLLRQGDEFPPGARWWLLAFEQAHDDAGQPQPQQSSFHVPDAYAAAVAARLPGRYAWVASIHPYREDALARLEHALGAGAVAVKWLPSAMNIDLRDARCRPFCARLARAGVPLIVHCGEEKAAPGAGRDELGNPLLVRHALAQGCTVIVAHCASLGHALDTDRPAAPRVPAFSLFARLMDEPGLGGRLLGDISAVFQSNRVPAVWRTVLQRADWHARLLHGSDHPLPGVMPLFSAARLQRAGLLDEADVPVLTALRDHNPLLFDLVLKRRLHDGGGRLPSGVFEAAALRTRAGAA